MIQVTEPILVWQCVCLCLSSATERHLCETVCYWWAALLDWTIEMTFVPLTFRLAIARIIAVHVQEPCIGTNTKHEVIKQ